MNTINGQGLARMIKSNWQSPPSFDMEPGWIGSSESSQGSQYVEKYR